MSEKRFIALGSRFIKDTLTGEEFYAPSEYELLDLLNEQQATIERLERKLELKTEEVEYLKRMMVKWGMVKDE